MCCALSPILPLVCLCCSDVSCSLLSSLSDAGFAFFLRSTADNPTRNHPLIPVQTPLLPLPSQWFLVMISFPLPFMLHNTDAATVRFFHPNSVISQYNVGKRNKTWTKAQLHWGGWWSYINLQQPQRNMLWDAGSKWERSFRAVYGWWADHKLWPSV